MTIFSRIRGPPPSTLLSELWQWFVHRPEKPVPTSLTSLSTQTSIVGNHLYLADQDDNGNIVNVGSHLACFMAGNWIMGE